MNEPGDEDEVFEDEYVPEGQLIPDHELNTAFVG
jgi:hypothetical protein